MGESFEKKSTGSFERSERDAASDRFGLSQEVSRESAEKNHL